MDSDICTHSFSAKVSVVVPIYNVAKWLDECLESIAAQTLSDIEVICVDDGSTDGSGEIAAAYAKRDGRFKVIHQEQLGVSSARNKGMFQARGEYLYFIDADDKLDLDALERLVAIADENQLDELIFSAHVFCDENYNAAKAEADYINKEKYCSINLQIERKPLSGGELLHLLLEKQSLNVLVYLRLYKLSSLRSYGVVFPENIMHEDEFFTPVALAHAQRAMAITERYYHRRLRHGSLMTTPEIIPKRICDCRIVSEMLKRYAETHWPDDSKRFNALIERSEMLKVAMLNISEKLPLEKIPRDCLVSLVNIYRQQRQARTMLIESRLKAWKRNTQQHETRISELLKQRSVRDNQISELEKRIEAWKKNCNEKDARIERLLRRHEDETNRLQTFGERMCELRKRNAKITKDLERLRIIVAKIVQVTTS